MHAYVIVDAVTGCIAFKRLFETARDAASYVPTDWQHHYRVECLPIESSARTLATPSNGDAHRSNLVEARINLSR